MSKYYYEIFVIPHEDYAEPKLSDTFRGGIVADVIGGIKDERLVVIGYEIVVVTGYKIVEDEDEQKPA